MCCEREADDFDMFARHETLTSSTKIGNDNGSVKARSTTPEFPLLRNTLINVYVIDLIKVTLMFDLSQVLSHLSEVSRLERERCDCSTNFVKCQDTMYFSFIYRFLRPPFQFVAQSTYSTIDLYIIISSDFLKKNDFVEIQQEQDGFYGSGQLQPVGGRLATDL